MNEAPPRHWRDARIEELDRLLQLAPDAVEARYERAGLLREQGAFEQAKRDYLELIRRKPDDFGVLNDFGTLALKAGYGSAARSLFEAAVRHHPNNAMGHVNLGNLLLLAHEREAARGHFAAALAVDPGHIHAHRGMGNVLAEIGDVAGARRHRDLGFRTDFLTTLPYRGTGAPIRLLLLTSAMGGNTPTATLLDDSVFQTTVLVAEYYDGATPLPAHDLVFNGIGDADLCGEGLAAARSIVARISAPIINHPRAVGRTGRLANADRLRGIANLKTPRVVRVSRRSLAGRQAAQIVASHGLSFPILARAPGFHTGQHFIRAETPAALAAAVEKFPGDDTWLIEPLDARDAEGRFRKYRVMIIDRRLYPLHMAISRHWKIHYYKADMADSADHRAKEVPFLDDMPAALGPRAMAALQSIVDALELDYGGIDFAVDRQGDVLLFEANATMVMVPLAADDKWAYRRPAFDAVFAAVRTMLLERSGAATAAGAVLPLSNASSPSRNRSAACRRNRRRFRQR